MVSVPVRSCQLEPARSIKMRKLPEVGRATQRRSTSKIISFAEQVNSSSDSNQRRSHAAYTMILRPSCAFPSVSITRFHIADTLFFDVLNFPHTIIFARWKVPLPYKLRCHSPLTNHAATIWTVHVANLCSGSLGLRLSSKATTNEGLILAIVDSATMS